MVLDHELLEDMMDVLSTTTSVRSQTVSVLQTLSLDSMREGNGEIHMNSSIQLFK